MNFKTIFAIVGLLLPAIFFSQENLPPAGPDEFYTIHNYSFKDASDKETIYKLENALKQMEFVKAVDIRYNELKKSGSITLTTLEKIITKENQEGFKPSVFKKYILKYGITPLEYRVIKSSGK